MLVYVFSLLRISRLSDITPPVLQTWCQLLQQFFKLSRRTTWNMREGPWNSPSSRIEPRNSPSRRLVVNIGCSQVFFSPSSSSSSSATFLWILFFTWQIPHNLTSSGLQQLFMWINRRKITLWLKRSQLGHFRPAMWSDSASFRGVTGAKLGLVVLHSHCSGTSLPPSGVLVSRRTKRRAVIEMHT